MDQKNKKKVVLVVEAMLGGVRQHVVDIALGLDKEKYEVYLIYSDLRADDKFYTDKEELEKKVCMILCNEMGREISIKKDWKAYKFVVNQIKKIKPDIVHCHSSKGGVIGRLAAKRCGVAQIYYTPHAYVFQSPNIGDKKRFVYILAERFLSKAATTTTINVSKGEMQKALDYNIDKRDKFTLIYNGIAKIKTPDITKIRLEEGFSKSTKLVGVTARCAEQKDPMTFLKIAKAVTQKRKDVEFIYIGDGNMETKMKKWIKSEKLDSKIHMLGFRNNASEIVGILDIYLSTALFEGLPYSIIEAMRAGVPLIVTNVDGNNELVVQRQNGLLFEPGSVESAFNLIIRQLEENVIKHEDVTKTFEEKFSISTMLNKLTSIYQLGNASSDTDVF